MLANPQPSPRPVASELMFNEALITLSEWQGSNPNGHLRATLRLAPDLWRDGATEVATRTLFEAMLIEIANLNEKHRAEVRDG